MKGDAKLSLFILSICITFQKLHKQATQQNIQVTTEAQGPMELWLRAILKASWELAALIENQLPLTFQESLILFSIWIV